MGKLKSHRLENFYLVRFANLNAYAYKTEQDSDPHLTLWRFDTYHSSNYQR
jgi:hypothetical protein